MKVQVTRDDINRGMQGNPYSCALALAVTRTFDKVPFVGHVGVKMGGEWCDLPPEASKFIYNFDNDRTSVEPFEFELECQEGR